MYKFFWLISITGFLFSCRNSPPVEKQLALYDSFYKPAVFTDAARLEKIKKAIPVIDSLYKVTAVMNHFPGLAYGIVVDGKLIHTGNYGFTDIEKKIPVTSSSLFRIASMSKSFTAMAILLRFLVKYLVSSCLCMVERKSRPVHFAIAVVISPASNNWG